MWLAVFSALAGTTIHGIYNVLYNYYQYEVITSSDISRETQIPFPAITVCNINKVYCCSKILLEPLSEQLVQTNNNGQVRGC